MSLTAWMLVALGLVLVLGMTAAGVIGASGQG